MFCHFPCAGPSIRTPDLVSRFSNISFYRCVGLSTSLPSDWLLIQCLLSSRLLGVRARSSPNLRPNPWGGIGHPTGNPVREVGSIAGRVGRITVRNAGTSLPGCPHKPSSPPSASRIVASVDRIVTDMSTQRIVNYGAAGGPIFDRERELARIGQLLDGVSERGAALLVRGEPGIGKSTLLAAASQRAEAAGMRVLR